MEPAKRVQILDEAVFDIICAIAIGKEMNPALERD